MAQQGNVNKGHINTFTQGMDKDTAHQKYSNMKYEHAENLRLLTDDGLSTGAMLNIEGNEKLISLPNITTITGNLGETANVSLQRDPSTAPYNNQEFLVYFGEEIDVTNDQLFEVDNITIVKGDGSITFVFPEGYNGGITNVTGGGTIEYTTFDNYYILGSANIRDSIILFTTLDQSETGGLGQIWKVDYDKATLESTATLILSNKMNFSTRYMIEAVGRYETIDIQRVYWTDNFNTLRSINIVDPNVSTTSVNFLSLTPEVTVEQPRFTEIGAIGSGQLPVGTYTVTYRVQSKLGSTTNIAPWSAPISINAAEETAESWNYQRSNHVNIANKANKSLSFTIDQLPDGYEYIEIFLLKRGVEEGILYKVDTDIIKENSSYSYTITGNEGEFEEIFKDDIESFNVIFDTVKTINIKDNRLIVGNITEKSQVIDFDARTYRHRVSDGTSYKPLSTNTNPYNKDSTRNFPYVPTPNGQTISHDSSKFYNRKSNVAEYGGTGANVSYGFTLRDIDLDTIGRRYNFPMVDNRKNKTDVTINGKKYNTGGLWNNYQNPYIEHLLTGYQRSETYRFGILFYDKYSRPLDVKWIEDIRMPDFDSHPSHRVTNAEDSRVVGQALGLNFKVDISSIKDKISGFSIVRSPRPNKDKTIMAQGIVGDVSKETTKNNFSVDGAYATLAPDDIGYYGHDVKGDSLVSVDRHYIVKGTYGRQALTKHDTVVVFDSPQLLNGWGESNLYGNIIGDETEGIKGFGGMKLRPAYITQTANATTGLYDFGAYNITADENLDAITGDNAVYYEKINIEDANNRINLRNYDATVRESLYPIIKPTINVRVNKPYRFWSTTVFKNDADAGRSTAASRDIVDSSIGVLGAIRTTYYSDNYKIDNYTKTNLLNTGDNLNYYSREYFSRMDRNSNSILLGLDRGFSDTYRRIFGFLPEMEDEKYLTYVGGQAKVVANLYRENPGQYGGTGQADIDSSSYIHTGHYQRVDKNSPDVIDAEVWGGDTFINLNKQVVNYPNKRVDNLNATYVKDSYLDGTAGYDAAAITTLSTFFNTAEYTGPLERETQGGTERNEYNDSFTGGHYDIDSDGNKYSTDYRDLYSISLENKERRNFAGSITPLESTVNLDMIYDKSFTDYKDFDEVFERRDELSYDKTFKDDPTMQRVPFFHFYACEGHDYLLDHLHKINFTRDVGDHQAENFSDEFFSLSSLQTYSSEFDNRVYSSGAKKNGETADSWSAFTINNMLEVDGHLGPINKLEVFNDNLIFFQDKGFGAVAVNPRSLITDAGGAQLELGTGDVLHDFNYVSTEIGSKHQRGIIKSKNAIYFFDANSRKFYRFRGQGEPLSDMKGMSSYFYNNLKGKVLSNDNPLHSYGISAGFDPRYNEVLFTYKDSIEELVLEGSMRAASSPIEGTLVLRLTEEIEASLNAGDSLYILDQGGTEYVPVTNFVVNPGVVSGNISVPALLSINISEKLMPNIAAAGLNGVPGVRYKTTRPTRETVVYSEAIDAFSGFYSFTPHHYITDSVNFFTPNPTAGGEMWVHNKGTRCSFYGADPSPSILRIIANPQGMNSKVFNNIEYLSQLQDTDGNDIVDETFNNLKVYNEYQSADKEIVIYGNPLLSTDQMHARRRMRNWRMQIPRAGAEKARIRNPYTTMEFTYNNNDDKKLILNDIITYYMDVPM